MQYYHEKCTWSLLYIRKSRQIFFFFYRVSDVSSNHRILFLTCVKLQTWWSRHLQLFSMLVGQALEQSLITIISAFLFFSRRELWDDWSDGQFEYMHISDKIKLFIWRYKMNYLIYDHGTMSNYISQSFYVNVKWNKCLQTYEFQFCHETDAGEDGSATPADDWLTVWVINKATQRSDWVQWGL